MRRNSTVACRFLLSSVDHSCLLDQEATWDRPSLSVVATAAVVAEGQAAPVDVRSGAGQGHACETVGRQARRVN